MRIEKEGYKMEIKPHHCRDYALIQLFRAAGARRDPGPSQSLSQWKQVRLQQVHNQASIVLDVVLWPPHLVLQNTWWCLCIYVVMEAACVIEGRRVSSKSPWGERKLLGGTEEKNITSEGSLFFTSLDPLIFDCFPPPGSNYSEQ